MSVYIRELSRQLGLRGHRVDIFTRVGDGHAPGEVLQMSEKVRLIPIEMAPRWMPRKTNSSLTWSAFARDGPIPAAGSH